MSENTYSEKLEKVNASIKTTNIKGKDYAEVNQRILAFWSLFPHGRITTEVTRLTDDRCDISCSVYREATDTEPSATGHAYETRNGMINSTSYVENCETSAIGRALGVLGIGSTTALASAEEVSNAIQQQETASNPPKQSNHVKDPRLPLYERIAALKKQAIANGVREEGINDFYEVTFGNDTAINKLDDAQLADLTAYLEQIVSDTADGHLLNEG